MSAAVRITSAHPAGGLASRSPWKALLAHHAHMGGRHLREIFAADPERGTRFTLEAAGLYLDYSKNRIDAETLRLLMALALDCDLRGRTAAMFRGELINGSEKRAALHTALRAPASERIVLDGVNVVAQVHATLDRMAKLAGKIRNGQWLGHTGKRIRNVVNIGIGGSDLISSPRKPFSSCARRASRRSKRSPMRMRPVPGACKGLGMSSPLPGTLLLSRRTPRRSRNSASLRPTCSRCGTGLDAATRWIDAGPRPLPSLRLEPRPR